MGPKTRIVTGAVLTLLACLVFWVTERWLTTRIFEPIQIPLSLAAGQFETEFQVNLRADYFMQLDLDYSPDDWYADETDRCNEFRLKRAEWKIFRFADSRGRGEELWAASDLTRPLNILWSEFRATPGKHRVRLEIPESAICLNPRHPRLRVWTDRSSYDEACGWIEFFCFWIGSSGAILALRGSWQWLLGLFKTDFSLRIFPEITLRNVVAMARHRPMPPISGFRHLTVSWIAVLCALNIIFFFYLTRPYGRYGFWVDFGKPKTAVTTISSPWPETLSVYVDSRDRFLVNGEWVSKGRLEGKLKEELGKRAVWTVYVEADMESSFQQTIFAMDTIVGLGGKVIWITPKTRKEWEESKEKPLVRVYYPFGAHGWRKADPTQ